MPERPKAPDPKSKDYQIKSNLTADIASGRGNSDVINPAVLKLGEVLTTNGLLSGKQKDQLLQSLEEAGLLHYCDDFDSKYDYNLDDPNSTLDEVRWKLEQDIRLQTAIIVMTYQLSLMPPPEQALEGLVSLFNTGHQAVGLFHDEHIKFGLNYLSEYEERVFANRAPLAGKLRSLHLIEPDSAEEVVELDNTDELRELGKWGQTYDRLMALYFYENGLRKDDPYNAFTSLQTIAYIGFAMGVRDISDREYTETLDYKNWLLQRHRQEN